jgi:hypothetical protein
LGETAVLVNVMDVVERRAGLLGRSTLYLTFGLRESFFKSNAPPLSISRPVKKSSELLMSFSAWPNGE